VTETIQFYRVPANRSRISRAILDPGRSKPACQISTRASHFRHRPGVCLKVPVAHLSCPISSQPATKSSEAGARQEARDSCSTWFATTNQILTGRDAAVHNVRVYSRHGRRAQQLLRGFQVARPRPQRAERRVLRVPERREPHDQRLLVRREPVERQEERRVALRDSQVHKKRHRVIHDRLRERRIQAPQLLDDNVPPVQFLAEQFLQQVSHLPNFRVGRIRNAGFDGRSRGG